MKSKRNPFLLIAKVITIIVTGILIGFVSLAVFRAVLTIKNDIDLESQGKIADASVINWRKSPVSRRRYNLDQPYNYDVQYVFILNKNPSTVYSHTDGITNKENRWTSVTQKEWEQSKESKIIQVLYLPSNPKVNRAVYLSHRTTPIGDSFAGTVLFALADFALICFLIKMIMTLKPKK